MAEAKEEKTVTKNQMLVALKKKQAALVAGAKAPKKPGYMDDSAILMKLGIEEKVRKTYPARVSKIEFSFAKEDTNRPAFRFYYMIESQDPRANGTVVNNYFILEEASNQDGEVWRTLEEAASEVCGEFESIGEDVTHWKDPMSNMMDAAERITKEKPQIMLTIGAYKNKKGVLVMTKTPSPFADNSDLDAADEAGDDTVESSEETSSDDNDPSVWVGYWIEFEHESVEGTVRMKVTAYDPESDTFSGVDENNEEWSGDYAIPATHSFIQSDNQAD